ncbi:hypothetical protein EDD86DRAFT_248092 [Gorgonomyces haynaldii]|nr:hypothetical protein EDD86DRAFT_248092 [Gorgonomyces haynaldii]
MPQFIVVATERIIDNNEFFNAWFLLNFFKWISLPTPSEFTELPDELYEHVPRERMEMRLKEANAILETKLNRTEWYILGALQLVLVLGTIALAIVINTVNRTTITDQSKIIGYVLVGSVTCMGILFAYRAQRTNLLENEIGRRLESVVKDWNSPGVVFKISHVDRMTVARKVTMTIDILDEHLPEYLPGYDPDDQ